MPRSTDHVVVTVRLPRATRIRIRALAAVTGLSRGDLIVEALAHFHPRSSPSVRPPTARGRRARRP
jgi:hypothetical protein